MSKLPVSESILLDGPVGPLEAILEAPADGVISGCAVVCHPHPQHGGTMQNKVAHMLARAFINRQMAALRFNFRGVGKSQGDFDHGIGEQRDVLAAAGWLCNRYPALPLWLAGFSFGAAIAVLTATKTEAAGLVSIAPAVSRVAEGMTAQPDCPWLIVQGDSDDLVGIEETIEWVNSLEPGPELLVFENTDHFFHGKLVQLRDAVESFIDQNRGPIVV